MSGIEQGIQEPAGAESALEPIVILTNDRAGALHAKASVEDLQKQAEGMGLAAQVIGTHSSEEMKARLEAEVKRGASRVAVAGGDGTVHLAAQVLAGTDTALGILAQGTANNFATALRLPLDMPSALRVLKEGTVKPVDLGMACDEYFTESAGIGLFANALSIYGPANKNLFRALWAIGKIVFSLHASRIRLEIDGELVEERAVMCTAANTYRMAAALPIAPGAKATDGELDVIILGDLNRSELIPYFRAIRAQTHLNLPKVRVIKAKRVRIESRRRMLVHCDDRIVCRTPVTIEAKPGILKVLIDTL